MIKQCIKFNSSKFHLGKMVDIFITMFFLFVRQLFFCSDTNRKILIQIAVTILFDYRFRIFKISGEQTQTYLYKMIKRNVASF